MSHRVELLAPAGSPEGFFGALHAGADAVYLAGSRFGARAYADNFIADELVECIRYAHILGRRVYLTVNTLIKDTEFAELYDFLGPLYAVGLDGVILQDIGVFLYIKRNFPQLKLHVSTQMTLTGGYGASMLREMGASRVVPARELSLAEIRTLKESSGLEVETFIHGAMCYCYSGQCLFSSILGGRSGNRGRCAQPCRLPYRVERDGRRTEECYPLSLKDLCTIEHLPELIEAGIDSFKIEGRMKKPEYTAGVTAVYRKYIDLYYKRISDKSTRPQDTETTREGSPRGPWRIEQRDMALLSNLYIRSERQDGYYYRHNGSDMVTLHDPAYSGSDEAALAAIRERYISTRPKRPVTVTAEFAVGKPAKVTLRTESMTVTATGETVGAALKQPVTEENLRKQLGKFGNTLFEVRELHITVDENAFYSLKAVNELRREAVSLLEDALIRQNGFAAERITIEHDTEPITTELTTSSQPEEHTDSNTWTPTAAATGTAELHVSLRDMAQLQAVTSLLGAADRADESNHADNCKAEKGYRVSRVYVDGDLLCTVTGRDTVLQRCRLLCDAGCEVVLALPPILRKRDTDYLERLWELYRENGDVFTGFLVRSMEGMGFLREKGCDALYADAGFYVWNSEALRAVGEPGGYFALRGFCLPYELNAGEQHRLLKREHIPCEKIVYGRIPLMVTVNCVANTIDGCNPDRRNTEWTGDGTRTNRPSGRSCDRPDDACGEVSAVGAYHLLDRYNKRFPILRCCAHCMNIIYNSLPLSLHKELHKWQKSVDFRLDFTVEDERETAAVLRYFMSGAEGAPPYREHTTGHEKRGAE